MAFQWLQMKSAILVLVIFSTIVSSFIDASKRHSKRASSSSNHLHECTDCASRKRKQEQTLSQQDMISIRTQIIKNQILQKLRLSEAPKTNSSTPAMLKEFLHTDHPSLEEIQTVINERKSREFYGKIISVAVLPETSLVPSPHSSYSSILMSFRLTPAIVREEMVSAELWFYNINDSKKHKHRMTVWEVVNEEPYTTYKRFISDNKEYKPLAWQKVNVDVSKWVPSDDKLHFIEITCSTCDETLGPIAVSEHNKPFIIIRMNSTASTAKYRRSSACTNTNSFGCCKQPLFINFTDIGWSNWILQPPGYWANYCRGHCVNDLDIYRHNHTSVMREVLRQNNWASELDLKICCTPSKMSSLSLIYKENEEIVIKLLDDMVVDECECA